jgi:hypothetical protein
MGARASCPQCSSMPDESGQDARNALLCPTKAGRMPALPFSKQEPFIRSDLSAYVIPQLTNYKVIPSQQFVSTSKEETVSFSTYQRLGIHALDQLLRKLAHSVQVFLMFNFSTLHKSINLLSMNDLQLELKIGQV